MELLKRAKALQNELTELRRRLHATAEVGFDVEKTQKIVTETLKAYGYAPKACGKGGVIADVGKGKTQFLLRADVDALPIREKTELPFAAKNGNMHACGHDIHAAMLLGAAKLLKENETRLKGGVRLLFQPAEELLEGATDMIRNGAIPKTGAGVMLHVMTGVPLKTGTLVVSSAGVSAPAADFFEVRVRGKACHGSAPQNGVDALSAAAHILVALQEVSAREIPAGEGAVLTVGKLQAGNADNAIADEAVFSGTLRAFSEETRTLLKTRLQAVSKGVAKAFRAVASVRFKSGCPTLLNDGQVSKYAYETLRKTLGNEVVYSAEVGGGTAKKSGGSEDFAYISQLLPSVMLGVGAGNEKEGYEYPLHHPKATFDERALPIGAYAFTALALGKIR